MTLTLTLTLTPTTYFVLFCFVLFFFCFVWFGFLIRIRVVENGKMTPRFVEPLGYREVSEARGLPQFRQKKWGEIKDRNLIKRSKKRANLLQQQQQQQQKSGDACPHPLQDLRPASR